MARAYAALAKAPRRSILFAAVAAEEQGLLGSEYLAHHPPVPLGRIAVDINIDGANVFGRTRDVTVIGLGKTDLDPTLRALARAQGRVLRGDQLPDRGYFYRSDQFSFARVGVPSAYFESGLDYRGRPAGWGREKREAWEETRYHQPSDELTPDWDLSGAVEDARLQFALGYSVAQATSLPAWTPGDEFEAARLRSLEVLRHRTGAHAGQRTLSVIGGAPARFHGVPLVRGTSRRVNFLCSSWPGSSSSPTTDRRGTSRGPSPSWSREWSAAIPTRPCSA